jgi:sporulation protein YlmC with PRC-barrel domain
LLALTLALAACGPMSEDDGTGTGAGTPGVETTAEVTVEPAVTATAAGGEVGGAEGTPGAVVTDTADTTDLNVVSNLIGYDVENQNGDDLGTIDSLIADRQGRLVYAILEAADDLEIDGEMIAVPWNSFNLARADQNLDDDVDSDLVFNQDQNVLTEAPAFASGDDFDVNDVAWDDDLVNYWGSRVSGLPNTGADAETSLVRLRDVTDYQLLNADGEDIGDVEDMILDTAGKQIAYVIWASGGILDIGEELIPVPFEKASWERDNDDAFVLNISDAEQVQDAPRLDSIDEIDTSVADWDNEFRTWWNNFTSGDQPSQ